MSVSVAVAGQLFQKSIEKAILPPLNCFYNFSKESVGQIYPETLDGTLFYEITSDTNIEGIKKQKQFFAKNEKHYVTEKGEAFFLPGYMYKDGDLVRWYINERKFYLGEGIIVMVDKSILTIAFPHPYGIKKIMRGHKSIVKV